MWSGLTFSVTFRCRLLSPMWGSLADRKGRKLMLRASRVWRLPILLQSLAPPTSAAVYPACGDGVDLRLYSERDGAGGPQVPQERSGWAHSTLSTAQISAELSAGAAGRLSGRPCWAAGGVFITAILLRSVFSSRYF